MVINKLIIIVIEIYHKCKTNNKFCQNNKNFLCKNH